jgi:TPR repeat protein
MPLSCLHCGQPAQVKCGQCKQAWFCGAECQRAAWKGHKPSCHPPGKKKDYKKKAPKPPSQDPTPGELPAARLLEIARARRAPEKARPDDSGTDCSICLDPMHAADKAVLPCGHEYHCKCIASWRRLGANDKCPECRVSLPPGPEQFFDAATTLLVRADRARDSGEQASAAPLFDQAISLFEQVLREDPKHTNAQYDGLGAAYALGYCYGRIGEFTKAVGWYQQAVTQGHEGAQFNLGGYASAQFNLGMCYANGEGVPKDMSTAVEWYRKAAAQGDAGAQYNLGACYAQGDGVPKDMPAAVEWYRKATAQGHVNAQFTLGVCYATGEGVPKDMSTAVAWHRKAAAQGDADAQCNLGCCYAGGDGVPRDMAAAAKWWRKAAAQGHANAQGALRDPELFPGEAAEQAATHAARGGGPAAGLGGSGGGLASEGAHVPRRTPL